MLGKVAQSSVQPGPEYFQRWGIYILSGQRVPVPQKMNLSYKNKSKRRGRRKDGREGNFTGTITIISYYFYLEKLEKLEPGGKGKQRKKIFSITILLYEVY